MLGKVMLLFCSVFLGEQCYMFLAMSLTGIYEYSVESLAKGMLIGIILYIALKRMLDRRGIWK